MKANTLKHLKIRSARAQDKTALAQIAEDTELFPGTMLDGMITSYLSGASQDIWLVGELNADPICFGYCAPEQMTDSTWNLLAIGVLTPFQGQGLGTQLIRAVEAHLRAQGERLLLVETMGTPDFAQTRQFYRQNGYTEEARIRDFYEAGGDKIVFWKRL